jgi:hypothetical protein
MTAPVIRMMIVSDATAWSVIYNRHSDNSNIFIILATEADPMNILWCKIYSSFFCKLGHFEAIIIFFLALKWSNLEIRMSLFTPEIFYEIDS